MPNHSLNTTTYPSINLYLKSEEATESLSNSHKRFRLKQAINQSSRPDIQTLVGLTNFECPASFYLINNTNNKIGIIASNVNKVITIDNGNYDIYTLLIEIETKCFEIKDEIFTTITTLFNDKTNKISFVSSNGNIIVTEQTTCDRILGCENALPTQSNTTIEFDNVCNLSGTSSIYIKLKGVGLNNLNSKGEIDETLAKINVEVLPSEFVFYEDEAENIYYLIDNDVINNVEILLCDDRNNELDLNGNPFSLVLTFHFVYRREEEFNSSAFLLQSKANLKEEEEKQNK